MNKSILAVLVVAAGLAAGLYSLPKVVVQNEKKQLAVRPSGTSPTDSLNTASTASGPVDAATKDRNDTHAQPLTVAQQQQISQLRRKYTGATGSQRPQAAESLMAYYRSVSRYDSAAAFAGQVARDEPSEATLLQAGNAYFEAYGFALDEQKARQLGQKTRDFYQQVLAKNPGQLAAKANMAMTYVNTQTPMQGIMLLREVLQQDPANELALFNLGLLSMRSGQMERAMERFRQILVNDPTNRKAKFYLGISLAEAGQDAEARKVLAQVKADERDPQILAAIQEYEAKLKK